MFVTGIGGSGKSHVIRAIVEMFHRCGAPEKLTLSAPTGSAAVLIDGYTIHALTFLPKRQAPIKQNDLEFIWRTVEYLILDEASLMSAELLSSVSQRICQAKSWDETARDKPFGGVNVIFAGDFGQLRPPRSNALYSYRLVRQLAPATMQTITGQAALHGAFLWRQVDTVVELRQNWRAKLDAPFVEMLNRIRVGKARKGRLAAEHVSEDEQSDYDILKSRMLSEIKRRSVEEFEGFKDAPIVVTKKFLRDAINESKAHSFARATTQEFEVYHARDTIGGKNATPQQQKRLWKLQSTHTNDMLGELPLISGMPVMIKDNAATSCKIVNGSRGTLKTVTYEVDGKGNRYAACALVDLPGSALYVPGLDAGVVPILPITSSFKFTMRESSVNIRRKQLPILPGWAFTDFKVQGSSISPVIVDLTWAKSLQSMYVMLSRASSLKDIAVLRWFSSKTLNSDLQADAREELKRLSDVGEETRKKYEARKRSNA
jgi:ATP-dependent DNA helicase PIF1